MSNSLLVNARDRLPVSPFTYDETLPGGLTGFSLTGVGVANTLILAEAPRRFEPITIAKIRVYIGAQSGNIDVGVWTFDGTTWTLRASSGSVAAGSGSAIQALSMLASASIPGRVRRFYGVAADNTTVTFGRPSSPIASVAALENRVISKASSFPLATNAASFVAADLAAAQAIVPWLRGSAT